MRAAVRTYAGLASCLFCVGMSTGGATPLLSPAGAIVVVLRAGGCSVTPNVVDAGSIALQLVNKTTRPARFVLLRTTLGAEQMSTKSRIVRLAAGRDRYTCFASDRRVGAGFVQVRPSQQSIEHRIAVRRVGGVGQLYDRRTGSKFVPRGNNYVRLADQQDVDGRILTYHSTFNVGHYDGARADVALKRMAADGYNTIRVFLSGACADACSGDPATGSLRTAYFANVADFTRKAKSHGIFVLLTSDWLPPKTTYSNELASVRYDWFQDINVLMLSPQGVAAQAHFWSDLVLALRGRKAAIDDIFAYELWNEAFLNSDRPPFTLTNESVTTANGSSYDMGSVADRQRMIDDGFVFLIDQVRQAIRRVDPTALVTMGFFHDTTPNPSRYGDNRLVRTGEVIKRSRADFVDIHPYPATELSFPEFMQNYGIDGPTIKPIIMGEFGGFKFAYPSAADAAESLARWQRESCAFGIDGWLLWTWDSTEQPDLWNARDAGGAIEKALSPANRRDPCGR